MKAGHVERFRRVFQDCADRPALVDCLSARELTYRELEDVASRIAARVRAEVRSHDRVLLLLPNGAEMVVSYLACMQLGAVSIPVNTAFSDDEIHGLVRLADPALILTDAAGAARLPPALRTPILRWDEEGSAGLSLTRAALGPRLHEDPFPGARGSELAHIVFSSGTTGTPKAIPIRLDRILGHAAMFSESHALGPTNRFYNVLPLAYLGGWYNLTLVPLLAGGTVVLDREFGMAGMYRFWAAVLEHGVDCLWFTPSMLSALLAIGVEDEAQKAAIRARIRWAMVGMAPLPPTLKTRFEEAFGFRLQQSYGLSETFLFTSWMSDVSLPDASVGKPLGGYDVRLVDGEILVRGEWMMDGYWNQPALTAKVLDADGYFRTGDLGRFDGEGRLFITGRKKDLIIRGGVNISPAEIEATLLAVEGVLEAAVVGVADELYGERIVAFVTATPSAPSVREILRVCRKRLSAAKVPSALHVIEAMPLNASGKIHKAALRERCTDASKS